MSDLQLTDWLAILKSYLQEGDYESAERVASAIVNRANKDGLYLSERERYLVACAIMIRTVEKKGDSHD